jgi:hypothetical protein
MHRNANTSENKRPTWPGVPSRWSLPEAAVASGIGRSANTAVAATEHLISGHQPSRHAKGPSTYEMEGPFRPGRASEPMTRRPVRCLANHRASGTRERYR